MLYHLEGLDKIQALKTPTPAQRLIYLLMRTYRYDIYVS